MSGINSEVDRLLRSLFHYASKKREEGVYDMTEVLNGFYRERMLGDTDSSRNSITKRFSSLTKEYVKTDPRRQGRMDNYLGSAEKN